MYYLYSWTILDSTILDFFATTLVCNPVVRAFIKYVHYSIVQTFSKFCKSCDKIEKKNIFEKSPISLVNKYSTKLCLGSEMLLYYCYQFDIQLTKIINATQINILVFQINSWYETVNMAAKRTRRSSAAHQVIMTKMNL